MPRRWHITARCFEHPTTKAIVHWGLPREGTLTRAPESEESLAGLTTGARGGSHPSERASAKPHRCLLGAVGYHRVPPRITVYHRAQPRTVAYGS